MNNIHNTDTKQTAKGKNVIVFASRKFFFFQYAFSVNNLRKLVAVIGRE